jgi:hypothetical protein
MVTLQCPPCQAGDPTVGIGIATLTPAPGAQPPGRYFDYEVLSNKAPPISLLEAYSNSVPNPLRYQPDSKTQPYIEGGRAAVLERVPQEHQKRLPISFSHCIRTEPGQEKRRVGPRCNQVLVFIDPSE